MRCPRAPACRASTGNAATATAAAAAAAAGHGGGAAVASSASRQGWWHAKQGTAISRQPQMNRMHARLTVH
ncbi:hypothetical protein PF008_g27957, partial [Phytophthora fragariae]